MLLVHVVLRSCNVSILTALWSIPLLASPSQVKVLSEIDQAWAPSKGKSNSAAMSAHQRLRL